MNDGWYHCCYSGRCWHCTAIANCGPLAVFRHGLADSKSGRERIYTTITKCRSFWPPLPLPTFPTGITLNSTQPPLSHLLFWGHLSFPLWTSDKNVPELVWLSSLLTQIYVERNNFLLLFLLTHTSHSAAKAAAEHKQEASSKPKFGFTGLVIVVAAQSISVPPSILPSEALSPSAAFCVLSLPSSVTAFTDVTGGPARAALSRSVWLWRPLNECPSRSVVRACVSLTSSSSIVPWAGMCDSFIQVADFDGWLKFGYSPNFSIADEFVHSTS